MEGHCLAVKVYLEDTDAQGIVYHANYLKFFERARSEILAGMGIELAGQGRGTQRFVVHEVEMKYRKPALLGDELEIVTSFEPLSEYRLLFHHGVHRDGDKAPLVSAEVQVVCVDERGELIELPNTFSAGA